jgi:hypothetical protein
MEGVPKLKFRERRVSNLARQPAPIDLQAVIDLAINIRRRA